MIVRRVSLTSTAWESRKMTADLLSCQSTWPARDSSASAQRSPLNRAIQPSIMTISTSSPRAARLRPVNTEHAEFRRHGGCI